MSKTRRFKHNKFVDDYDDYDDYDDSINYDEYINRRKNKKLKQALKTKNIDILFDLEEDEDL